MNHNKKFMALSGLLVAAALALAACSGAPSAGVPNTGQNASAGSVSPTQSSNGYTYNSASPTQAASSSSSSAAAPAQASSNLAANQHDVAAVDLGQVGSFGSVLVDDKGMTLYLFKKDTMNQSNCNAQCQSFWPPLLTKQAPTAGSGVDASKLGTIPFDSSFKQVTYNGAPLYYFKKDQKAGDFFGQGLQNVWYVVDAAGNAVGAAPASPAQAATTAATASSGTSSSSGAASNMHATASVDVAQVGSFGNVLVDNNGMTLYLFKKDTMNTSNCTGQCLVFWPPLLTQSAPTAGSGVDASKLGTIPFAGDSAYKQVTFNGVPLYYFKKDQKAGDFFGQGLQNLWYVVDPSGNAVGAASASVSPTQAPAVSASSGGNGW